MRQTIYQICYFEFFLFLLLFGAATEIIEFFSHSVISNLICLQVVLFLGSLPLNQLVGSCLLPIHSSSFCDASTDTKSAQLGVDAFVK